MEQRDFLQKQIEQLSLLFEAVISQIHQVQTSKEENNYQEVQNEFQKEAGFTLDEVLRLTPENLNTFIRDNLHNNLTLTERLAYLLEQVAGYDSEINGFSKFSFYQKAILLLEYADRNSDVYSIERSAKMEKLKSYIY